MTENILSKIELFSVGVALGADAHVPEILTPDF